MCAVGISSIGIRVNYNLVWFVIYVIYEKVKKRDKMLTNKKKTDREIEIEQQIAHLKWLRSQNERNYQNVMTKTRVIQQNDQVLKIAVDKNNEKFVRMKHVIKDELAKPLVLTDAESYELERQNLQRHEYFEKVSFYLLVFGIFSNFVYLL